MNRWLDKTFGFSRKELQGICVMFVLLLCSWIAPALYHWIWPPTTPDMGFYENEINHFLATAGSTPENKNHALPASVAHDHPLPAYFPFDPNQLSESGWARLGLSQRQISNIKNFQARGGTFRKKEDLKRMYTLSDLEYKDLEPYIQIQEELNTAFKQKAPSVEKHLTGEYHKSPDFKKLGPNIPTLEVNTADSLSLQSLPGIGPVFAARIVRFREHLGGFYHISQLLAVYGMDSIRYAGMKQYLTLDSKEVKKLDINEATYQELNAHPFISSKQANAIVQYRKQHGRYQQLADLLNIVVIDSDFMEKAGPYLKN